MTNDPTIELSPKRLEWPDTVRGLTIVIIVYYHVALLLSAAGYDVQSPIDVIADLQALGMTMFFAISGMNSRRYLDAPTGTFIRKRIWPMAYLLILWTGIDLLLLRSQTGIAPPGRFMMAFGMAVIQPTAYLWYLWSLLVYLLAGRFFVRRFPRLGLALGAVLAFVFLGLSPWHLRRYGFGWLADQWAWRSALSYFLFYLLGCLHRDRILALGHFSLVPSLVVFRGGSHLLLWLGQFARTALLAAPMRLAALFMGLVGTIYVGRLLSRLPGLNRALLWLGRLTLPVYLIHMLFVVPCVWGAGELGGRLLGSHPQMLAGVITLVALVCTLGLTFAARPLHLLWLLRPPEAPRNPFREGAAWALRARRDPVA